MKRSEVEFFDRHFVPSLVIQFFDNSGHVRGDLDGLGFVVKKHLETALQVLTKLFQKDSFFKHDFFSEFRGVVGYIER